MKLDSRFKCCQQDCVSSISWFSLVSCWLLSQISCEALTALGSAFTGKDRCHAYLLPGKRVSISLSPAYTIPVGHLTRRASASELLCLDFWAKELRCIVQFICRLCGTSCRPHGMRGMEGKSLNKDQRLWLKERGKIVGRRGTNIPYIDRNSILDARFLKDLKVWNNGLKI